MIRNRWIFLKRLSALVVIAVAMLAAMASCVGGDEPVYSRFVTVDPKGWDNSEYCVFRMSDADSSVLADVAARYDIILTVRHNTDYPYNNLWILFEKAVSPDSVVSAKVNLTLANTSGSWRGHGMQGLYEFSDTVMHAVPLSSADVLSVRHDMPVASVPGILDIGVAAVPVDR